MKRFLAALMLALGLASLGFGVGGGVSAAFMTGAGKKGLDGAATVALFALTGVVAGLLAAIPLGMRLPLAGLVRWATIALLSGIGSVVFFVLRA